MSELKLFHIYDGADWWIAAKNPEDAVRYGRNDYDMDPDHEYDLLESCTEVDPQLSF